MIKVYGKNCIHECIRSQAKINKVFILDVQAKKDDKFLSLLKDKKIPFEIVNKGNHYVVTLYGGLNGCGRLHNYLHDIQKIINQFDNVWLVNWDNDCPDDVWVLKIGIR